MTTNEAKIYLEKSGAKFIHVGIITDNIDAAIASLEAYPFVGKFERHTASFGQEFLSVGAPYEVIIAIAKMHGHDFDLEILQPVPENSDPENIYSVLLRKFKNGLSHVAYSVPTLEVFNRSVEAFTNAGYTIILKGGKEPGVDKANPNGFAFVYLDPDNGSNCFYELLLRSIL